MGRILELKNEMVQLESLEYHYFDDILVDMKLTPVGRVGGALREGLGRQVMYVCMYCAPVWPVPACLYSQQIHMYTGVGWNWHWEHCVVSELLPSHSRVTWRSPSLATS